MLTQEAIKKRRSIRIFEATPVPENIIEELVDCARLAPSAKNIQPWEFIVVTEKKVLLDLGSLGANGNFIKDCACCIAVFNKDTKYYLEDGCAATENILLAATDLGLSACWVAGDKKHYCGRVNELLGVPADFKLISLIPLGYSNAKPAVLPKRPLQDLLHWEKFGNRKVGLSLKKEGTVPPHS